MRQPAAVLCCRSVRSPLSLSFVGARLPSTKEVLGDMMDKETFDFLRQVISAEENKTCADCGEVDPVWASLGFGIFICLNCAGHHRSLGVHLTKVRSVKLDAWTRENVLPLQTGGNLAFQKFVASLNLAEPPTIRGKYENPQLLYYTEILKAKLEDRPLAEYDEAHWRSMASSSAAASPNTSQNNAPAVWVSDDTVSGCMVCSRQFSLLNRRHHCRRCGKVCCKECAPANNCRPIMEWGMKDPVRHCKTCYKSPAVDWKE